LLFGEISHEKLMVVFKGIFLRKIDYFKGILFSKKAMQKLEKMRERPE
jgi:hypothetical protein